MLPPDLQFPTGLKSLTRVFHTGQITTHAPIGILIVFEFTFTASQISFSIAR